MPLTLEKTGLKILLTTCGKSLRGAFLRTPRELGFLFPHELVSSTSGLPVLQHTDLLSGCADRFGFISLSNSVFFLTPIQFPSSKVRSQFLHFLLLIPFFCLLKETLRNTKTNSSHFLMQSNSALKLSSGPPPFATKS